MSTVYINLNGELLDESKCGLSVRNRAFRYGDGLFETIKVIDGKPVLIGDHFLRLNKGLKELHYKIPSGWDLSRFSMEVQKTLEKNKISKGGSLRFNVFRKGEGLYTPTSGEFGYTVEANTGKMNSYGLDGNGLRLGIFNEIKISPSRISQFKTNNCLPYIMAGIWASENGFDDAILLNDRGNICECISSNIFLVINGMLYTPSLKEGPTAGVMRKRIIQIAKKMNIAAIETSVSTTVLEEADEVFLTNAIVGIRWSSSFNRKRYYHKVSAALLKKLNEGF